MKIVRTLKLWFREGTSDKVYEVDLVDTETTETDTRFLVNFRYGRRGQALREGTKTSRPMALAAAEKIFDSVVVAKVNEGYHRMDGGEPVLSQTANGATPAVAQPIAEGRERALIARLEGCLSHPWPEKERDRLFWRVGELRIQAATPLLLQLVHKIGLPRTSYSMAWALVRCGGGNAFDTLVTLTTAANSPLVRGLAGFALVSPAMGDMQLRPQQTSTLPEAISRAIAFADTIVSTVSPDLLLPETKRSGTATALRNSADALYGALTGLAEREPLRASPALVELYCLAQVNPALHQQLAALVGRLPVRPPYVPGLRRMFKYAEMIDDAVMFGAVARRFELAKPMYNWEYRPKGSQTPTAWVPELNQGSYDYKPLTHLAGAPDARTAMSQKTMAFFKRRIWRAMRKRGEAEQTSYLDFVTSYLLAFTEADTVKPVTQTHYRWDYQTRRSYEIKKAYASLPNAWSVGQIMYRNCEHVLLNTGTLGYNFDTEQAGQTDTGEAFPDLWRDHPAYARRLVLEAQCEQVAEFGLRLLREQVKDFDWRSLHDGEGFEQALPSEMLERMLASPFDAVVTFAFDQVQKALAYGDGDVGLLAALLASGLQQARELAVCRVEKDAAAPWSNLRLAFIAATSPHADVQSAALKWAAVRPLPLVVAQALAPQLAAWLLEGADTERIRHLCACLPLLWPAHDLPLAPETIARLMAHGAADVRVAGIAMLAVSSMDAGALPDALWHTLLGSEVPEIQAAGLRLLGRLSDEQLADRAPLVASLATAASSEVRRSARPLIARLAVRFPRLADDLAQRVIDSLFRTAPDEAYAEDAVALVREALPSQFAALDANLIWRLLQAKAKGAQLLGATAVVTRDPGIYSVRQLARLGNHAHVTVRQWVTAAYDASPGRFQAEAADAVLLIETEWEDARAFAIAHFDRWPEETWTPEVLAVIADSTKPEILAYARSVLRRMMKPGDASVQLIRLLEHPATSMHLLITEVLTADAARDETVFAKLLPLSRIVLLQVHKGRVAKDRIGEFLHAQALLSRDRAAAITPIFTDLSLSILERDRTRAISALRDIGAAFPGVIAAAPLKSVPLAVRTA